MRGLFTTVFIILAVFFIWLVILSGRLGIFTTSIPTGIVPIVSSPTQVPNTSSNPPSTATPTSTPTSTSTPTQSVTVMPTKSGY